jgi:hypothetical protein
MLWPTTIAPVLSTYPGWQIGYDSIATAFIVGITRHKAILEHSVRTEVAARALTKTLEAEIGGWWSGKSTKSMLTDVSSSSLMVSRFVLLSCKLKHEKGDLMVISFIPDINTTIIFRALNNSRAALSLAAAPPRGIRQTERWTIDGQVAVIHTGTDHEASNELASSRVSLVESPSQRFWEKARVSSSTFCEESPS